MLFRKNGLLIFFFLIVFCQVGQGATEDFVFDSKNQQKHFESLLKEFRCVTCPNQNIADSQAPIAGAMRQEIYRRYRLGESPECIRDYLFAQYGDYVSYRPKMKIQNFPLWLMPFFMLSIGLAMWIKLFSAKKGKQATR